MQQILQLPLSIRGDHVYKVLEVHRGEGPRCNIRVDIRHQSCKISGMKSLSSCAPALLIHPPLPQQFAQCLGAEAGRAGLGSGSARVRAWVSHLYCMLHMLCQQCSSEHFQHNAAHNLFVGKK